MHSFSGYLFRETFQTIYYLFYIWDEGSQQSPIMSSIYLKNHQIAFTLQFARVFVINSLNIFLLLTFHLFHKTYGDDCPYLIKFSGDNCSYSDK